MAEGLREQPVEIVFSQGLDTKTHPHVVPAGKLTQLENYRFGDGTLERRPGSLKVYEPAEDTSDVKPGTDAMLGTRQGQLVLRDRDRLFLYSERLQGFVPGGVVVDGDLTKPVPPPALMLEKERVYGSALTPYALDCETLDGVTVYAWSSFAAGVGNDPWATVKDSEGNTLVPAMRLGVTSAGYLLEASGARVVRCAGALAVVFKANTDLKVRFLRTSKPTEFEEEVVLEAVDDYSAMDAVGLADGSFVVAVVRFITASTRTIRLLKVSSLGAVTASVNVATYANAVEPTGPRISVTVARDGNVFVAYAVKDGSAHHTIRGAVYSAALVSVTADAEILDLVDLDATADSVGTIALSPAYADDTAYLAVEYNTSVSGGEERYFVVHGVLAKALTWTQAGSLTDAALLTRPFRLGSRIHLGIKSPRILDSTLFTGASTSQTGVLVVNDLGFAVARFAMSAQPPIDLRLGRACNVPVEGAMARFLVDETNLSSPAEVTVLSAITLAEDRSTGAERLLPVEYRGSLYFPGAIPRQFDGQHLFEVGFTSFVDHFSVTATAGGSKAIGQHIVCIIAEETDAAGEVHQSAPYFRLVTTSAGFQTLTWNILSAPRTDRKNVRYAAYRSYILGGAPSSTLHYWGDITPGTPEADVALDDATFASHPVLYTTGDVLPGLPPQACKHLCVHEDRLGLAGTEDGALLFSTRYVPGVAPRFHPDFNIRPSGRFGRLVASASLPGRWVLLERDGLEYVTGDGPNELGTGGSFTPPQPIPSPTGCIAPQSVVSTPVGVFFQGDDGIWQLGNDLSLQYVGEPVESLTGQVTAAIHVPERKEVRFAQANPDVTLVYHYMQGQWSVNGRRVAVAATLWRGRITWADNLVEGRTSVFQENPQAASDNGMPIHSVVETAWMRLGNLHGLERVKWVSVLGTHQGRATLRLEIGYDEEPTYSETRVFHYTGEQNAVAGRPLRVRHKPSRQKCTAIRFRVTCDGGGEGPSQGFDLTSIGLLLGVKKGFKTSALKTLSAA